MSVDIILADAPINQSASELSGSELATISARYVPGMDERRGGAASIGSDKAKDEYG